MTWPINTLDFGAPIRPLAAAHDLDSLQPLFSRITPPAVLSVTLIPSLPPSITMSAEDVAKAFTNHYYQTLTNGADALAPLFVSNNNARSYSKDLASFCTSSLQRPVLSIAGHIRSICRTKYRGLGTRTVTVSHLISNRTCDPWRRHSLSARPYPYYSLHVESTHVSRSSITIVLHMSHMTRGAPIVYEPEHKKVPRMLPSQQQQQLTLSRSSSSSSLSLYRRHSP